MITFRCGECGRELSVSDEEAGRAQECPSCGKALVVPQQDAAPQERSDDAAAPKSFFIEHEDEAKAAYEKLCAAEAPKSFFIEHEPTRSFSLSMPRTWKGIAGSVLVAALIVWSMVWRTSQDEAHEHFNRGVDYAEKGSHGRAIAEYTKAIESKPDFAEAYGNRGNACAEKGDYDGAIMDYTKVIQLRPDDADAYYNRGVAYGRKDDLDRAIADWTKAIELDSRGRAGRAARRALDELKGQ